MSEISSLVERAQKYLKSAETLLQDEDYESSVSRSYYAMFYVAEALLLTKGLSFSSHKGVIAAFGKDFIKTGVFPKEMGVNLRQAFEKRQLGDYESGFVISKEQARDTLQKGEVFVEKIADSLKKGGFL